MDFLGKYENFFVDEEDIRVNTHANRRNKAQFNEKNNKLCRKGAVFGSNLNNRRNIDESSKIQTVRVNIHANRTNKARFNEQKHRFCKKNAQFLAAI